MSYSYLELKANSFPLISSQENMDFSKSKLLLKKINAIHDSVAAFGGGFSSLEKDLIVQYIRELYECITIEETVSSTTTEGSSSIKAPIAKKVSQAAPVQHAISSNGSSNGQAATSNGNANHITTPTVAKPKPTKIDPELDTLFEESNLNDLSQRFANAPIKDIGKAMGINERILTINELFKGDQQSFQSTAEALNACANFEDAKQYLVNGIATKNDWVSNKRKKKAAVFIKLIRRRYL